MCSLIKEEISEDGKNIRTIKCKFCPSIILKPKSADLTEMDEFDIPSFSIDGQSEKLKDFWLVEDMYTFYNVAFSKTISIHKLLACADCDAGPIGYHDINSKKSYVALSRVEYVD